MRIVYFIIIILQIVNVESWSQRQVENVNLIKVDLRSNYSNKKEQIIQDFMDVEYIALETNDDFLNQGLVLDIGKKYMLIRNQIRDGNIFVYERTGKALRKINRQGQGSEEYSMNLSVILDESNEEIFVNDIGRKIFVYDIFGKFKRSLDLTKEGRTLFFSEMLNYDNNNLICYDDFTKENIAFFLISKQDGSISIR